MFLREAPCLFCLNPSSARLGLDKKQRPYLHCVACGVRAFMPLYECLNGLAILPTGAAARSSWTAHRIRLLRVAPGTQPKKSGSCMYLITRRST